MAAVPMTLTGLYSIGEDGSITIVGLASRTDVGVGGGPMPGGPGRPVDPGYGVPERPVDPGYFPPRVQHPIVLPPDPPIDPPDVPPTNPPSDQWQWVWVASTKRWEPAYVPGPTDAQPH